jgi:virulence-associated protein VapD
VKQAAMAGDIQRNMHLFDGIQRCVRFCRLEISKGNNEFQSAELVLDLALMMHSFQTSLSEVRLFGIDAMVDNALNDLTMSDRGISEQQVA